MDGNIYVIEYFNKYIVGINLKMCGGVVEEINIVNVFCAETIEKILEEISIMLTVELMSNVS